MRLKILIIALGLSGCTAVDNVLPERFDKFIPGATSDDITIPPPPPAFAARPVRAAVDGATLLVDMDDGLQCRGAAGGNFGAAGWTGTLSECPYRYTYAVELAAGRAAGFVILDPVPVSPPGGAPFRALVAVTIIDLDGVRTRFESAEGF